MIAPNEPKYTKITIAITLAVMVLVGIVVTSAVLTELTANLTTKSLMFQAPYNEGGREHPWYIAPMKGCTVQLYNGSLYTVNSDFWDSCEYNPNQGHLIGIGFTNKTAYDERVELDQNIMTRNYTATFQTIVWVNATQVKTVIFESW